VDLGREPLQPVPIFSWSAFDFRRNTSSPPPKASARPPITASSPVTRSSIIIIRITRRFVPRGRFLGTRLQDGRHLRTRTRCAGQAHHARADHEGWKSPCPNAISGRNHGDINRRRGHIHGQESRDGACIITANVPLETMFGYATDIRSLSKGRAATPWSLPISSRCPPRSSPKSSKLRRKHPPYLTLVLCPHERSTHSHQTPRFRLIASSISQPRRSSKPPSAPAPGLRPSAAHAPSRNFPSTARRTSTRSRWSKFRRRALTSASSISSSPPPRPSTSSKLNLPRASTSPSTFNSHSRAKSTVSTDSLAALRRAHRRKP